MQKAFHRVVDVVKLVTSDVTAGIKKERDRP